MLRVGGAGVGLLAKVIGAAMVPVVQTLLGEPPRVSDGGPEPNFEDAYGQSAVSSP